MNRDALKELLDGYEKLKRGAGVSEFTVWVKRAHKFLAELEKESKNQTLDKWGV